MQTSEVMPAPTPGPAQPSVASSAGPPVDRLGAAAALVRSGDLTAALARLDVLSGEEPAPTGPDAARLLALLVDCRLARGDLSAAMTLGDAIAPHLVVTGPTSALAHHTLGELSAALGDPGPASEHFLAAGVDAASIESPALLPWRAGAALVLMRTGERRLAAELAAEHHRVALADGSSYAIATALRTLAATDAGSQRTTLLREARATLAGTGARRLDAQVAADLAGLLMLTTDPLGIAEAVALLRGAELYAGQQQLWPLQSRVRRLLDRCGEEPVRVSTEGLALLTTTEKRVAGLAAEGHTNRQVAEQLQVSVKAVEWHLSRTYRKLGIASRAALSSTFGLPT